MKSATTEYECFVDKKKQEEEDTLQNLNNTLSLHI